MISFKVAYNPSIAETRNRPAHIEDRATDMISSKVACNPTRNMAATIAGSEGPWVLMVG